MKTLTLVTLGSGRRPGRDELARMEDAGECPRALLFEDVLNSDILSEHYLQNAPLIRRALYKLLPPSVAQVLEAFFVKDKYDAVISWGERASLLFASFLKITGTRIPHIALMYWFTPAKKAVILKRVVSNIDRIITWSQIQRDIGIDRLHIPSSKIIHVNYFVDHLFWRPIRVETDMISAVGNEMRDYPTLLKAMKGLDIRCHIVAGSAKGGTHPTVKAVKDQGPLPPNVTIGRMSYRELRSVYARSRFVVYPLLMSETNHGITSILEAMAMGRAVICTRTKGHVDVIQDGRTGILVSPGDPEALRQAIQYLWNRPEEAERMGKEARKQVEQRHTFEQFANAVRHVVEEVIATNGTAKFKTNGVTSLIPI